MPRDTGRPAAVQAIRDSARWVLRRYGMATASTRPQAELLIIGTKRGGTTSLWRYLQEHPSVLANFPRRENTKGMYFFSENYCRGERWYRSHFPSKFVRRRSEARLSVSPVAIDATPYDLYHPLAPERAARVAPEAIAVALLRDPVERAFSHWKERAQHGETLSFEDAIEAEPRRCAGAEARLEADPCAVSFAHRHQSYLGQSSYLPMLERWRAQVPADQLLVWVSEEFYAEPQSHLDELTDRLGLPRHDLKDARPYNAVPAPDMRPETRWALSQRFEPEVAALSELLGRDLPWLGASAPRS